MYQSKNMDCCFKYSGDCHCNTYEKTEDHIVGFPSQSLRSRLRKWSTYNAVYNYWSGVRRSTSHTDNMQTLRISLQPVFNRIHTLHRGHST
ncbi:Hypothetical predicted protein [Octopus vulgaris]|uniref:Uncharacterized protein n=1 Tax=Octopus vulgaris TaxID=6645 RepID=A0AA36FC35_OCTVU|nr:Hypothetical predicted protein [Octopus vulgaris]